MTQSDFQNILSALSKYRLIFHSEADFQFELAWAIKKKYSNAEIRLERPYKLENNTKIETDLIIILNGEVIGIELKYVTKKATVTFNSESFNLKDHAANDLRRYDFYSDVSRLENLKNQKFINFGFSVFLTNVKAYQNAPNQKGVGDQFNLAEENIIQNKEYRWKDAWENDALKIKSVGLSRMMPLTIKNTYTCNWEKYSIVGSESFHYLLLEI